MCIDQVEWFAEEGKRAYGRIIPSRSKRCFSVMAAFGAFLIGKEVAKYMITRKVGPALAAGCSVIVRPTYVFSEIMHDAGVPAGVYNMLNGDGVGVGSQMSCHQDIDMISFTGSTRAGALNASMF